MSQIAAALARSKGKKVDPVPSADSVVPAIHTSNPPMPAPAAPAVPAKRKLRPTTVAALAAGAAVLTVALYFVFRPAPKPEIPAAKPKPAAVVTPAAPPAPEAKPIPKVEAPAPEAAPVASFPAELEQQLKALVISARRTGNEPRIVVGGKVFAPGDEVISGAVLDSVHADKVVFRDAAKNKFERR